MKPQCSNSTAKESNTSALSVLVASAKFSSTQNQDCCTRRPLATTGNEMDATRDFPLVHLEISWQSTNKEKEDVRPFGQAPSSTLWKKSCLKVPPTSHLAANTAILKGSVFNGFGGQGSWHQRQPGTSLEKTPLQPGTRLLKVIASPATAENGDLHFIHLEEFLAEYNQQEGNKQRACPYH